jgi:hypothetical protein
MSILQMRLFTLSFYLLGISGKSTESPESQFGKVMECMIACAPFITLTEKMSKKTNTQFSQQVVALGICSA